MDFRFYFVLDSLCSCNLLFLEDKNFGSLIRFNLVFAAELHSIQCSVDGAFVVINPWCQLPICILYSFLKRT